MLLLARLGVIGPVAVGTGDIQQSVAVDGQVVQAVRLLHDRLPLPFAHLAAHQDALVAAVAYLVDGIAVDLHHRCGVIALLPLLVVGLALVQHLVCLQVYHLQQTVVVEQQQILVADHLQILQVAAALHLVGALRLHVVEPLLQLQPHHVRLVHEQVGHLPWHAELLEHLVDRVHEALRHQVHARHVAPVLQPDVVVLVEIQMEVALVFPQRIQVLARRVDIREPHTVEEVDLTHRRDHQSPRLRTGHRLRTVVRQSVSRVIHKETIIICRHLQRRCQQ